MRADVSSQHGRSAPWTTKRQVRAVQVVAFARQWQALQIKTAPTGICEVATWEAASRFHNPHANRDANPYSSTIVRMLLRNFRRKAFHMNSDVMAVSLHRGGPI